MSEVSPYTDLLRLVLDFGLVVLIWLVQLIIYPGFLHYQERDLLQWHQKYTRGISLVVIPLMVGQLGLALLQTAHRFDLYTVVSMFLIIAVWAITFAQFVPLHRAISQGKSDKVVLRQLIDRNWWRTSLWNLIFFWSAIEVLF